MVYYHYNWPSGNKFMSSEDALEIGLRIGSNGDISLSEK
jgi:hypothetical protein